MPGLNWMGMLAAGGVLGAGLIALVAYKLWRGQQDKAKADTLESAAKGDAAANMTEANMLDARDKAKGDDAKKLNRYHW